MRRTAKGGKKEEDGPPATNTTHPARHHFFGRVSSELAKYLKPLTDFLSLPGGFIEPAGSFKIFSNWLNFYIFQKSHVAFL